MSIKLLKLKQDNTFMKSENDKKCVSIFNILEAINLTIQQFSLVFSQLVRWYVVKNSRQSQDSQKEAKTKAVNASADWHLEVSNLDFNPSNWHSNLCLPKMHSNSYLAKSKTLQHMKDIQQSILGLN